MLENNCILPLLPVGLRAVLQNIKPVPIQNWEEIRVREQRTLELVYKGGYGFVTVHGELTTKKNLAYRPTREDCLQLLDLISNHSLYTMEEELRRGFITVRGGHRIGISGKAVLQGGRVKHIGDITGFNIRLAREIKGAGKQVLPQLLDPLSHTVSDTLIISPPGRGKTTLIRDLARLISEGDWPSARSNWSALKVGIVDERSELAASHRGVPSFDVGPRTDVLDGCPKAEGMMMMIRSMSPDVIIVDEIGTIEDAQAIQEAVHAGIRVLATAHGTSLDDVSNRPALQQLLRAGIFARFVVLDGLAPAGTVEGIYNREGEVIPLLHARL